MRNSKYPNLFSKGRIGGLAIKNRIIRNSMGTHLAMGHMSVSEGNIQAAAEAASGGVGLVFMDNCTVKDMYHMGLCAADDTYIPGLSRMAEAIKDHGALAGMQLAHPGRDTGFVGGTDGVLVAGDAAALCANLGYTLHGMDLAVESGRLAALTILEAKEKEDYSAQTLSSYEKAIETSFVMLCMKEADTEDTQAASEQLCAAKKVNVAEKLGVNKYNTDEHNPHIEIDKEFPDQEEIDQIVRVCPAALYSVDENGNLFFDYLGCLECGTCKVCSEGKVVKNWNYLASTKGVEYRFG